MNNAKYISKENKKKYLLITILIFCLVLYFISKSNYVALSYGFTLPIIMSELNKYLVLKNEFTNTLFLGVIFSLNIFYLYIVIVRLLDYKENFKSSREIGVLIKNSFVNFWSNPYSAIKDLMVVGAILLILIISIFLFGGYGHRSEVFSYLLRTCVFVFRLDMVFVFLLFLRLLFLKIKK
ncbi:MAG: hypothetical protein ABII02_02095 [Candidatus Magasanikbacteria bacterium]